MIRFTNTLTRQLEEFQPQGDPVTMYVCGITPYDESHIGHAMSYIVFDVVKRYLRWRGYTVKHAQNFTDIDDRIIERANRLKISTDELVEKYIAMYFDDMRDLNVLPADVYPYATKEVPEMIAIVAGLIEKGFAYETSSPQSEWSDVYYRVSAKDDYGKLSHRTQDSLLAGARVETGEQKENAADFALWKGAKAGEPSWDSPWGKGRPGWHIECSAMSLKYLGERIDIHGGGEDLIFPHHENEIAQTEAYTGVVAVRPLLAAQRLGEDGRREDEQVARQLHHHPRRAEEGGWRRVAALGADVALPQAADVQRGDARGREDGRGQAAHRGTRARLRW